MCLVQARDILAASWNRIRVRAFPVADQGGPQGQETGALPLISGQTDGNVEEAKVPVIGRQEARRGWCLLKCLASCLAQAAS